MRFLTLFFTLFVSFNLFASGVNEESSFEELKKAALEQEGEQKQLGYYYMVMLQSAEQQKKVAEFLLSRILVEKDKTIVKSITNTIINLDKTHVMKDKNYPKFMLHLISSDDYKMLIRNYYQIEIEEQKKLVRYAIDNNLLTVKLASEFKEFFLKERDPVWVSAKKKIDAQVQELVVGATDISKFVKVMDENSYPINELAEAKIYEILREEDLKSVGKKEGDKEIIPSVEEIVNFENDKITGVEKKEKKELKIKDLIGYFAGNWEHLGEVKQKKVISFYKELKSKTMRSQFNSSLRRTSSFMKEAMEYDLEKGYNLSIWAINLFKPYYQMKEKHVKYLDRLFASASKHKKVSSIILSFMLIEKFTRDFKWVDYLGKKLVEYQVELNKSPIILSMMLEKFISSAKFEKYLPLELKEYLKFNYLELKVNTMTLIKWLDRSGELKERVNLKLFEKILENEDKDIPAFIGLLQKNDISLTPYFKLYFEKNAEKFEVSTSGEEYKKFLNNYFGVYPKKFLAKIEKGKDKLENLGVYCHVQKMNSSFDNTKKVALKEVIVKELKKLKKDAKRITHEVARSLSSLESCLSEADFKEFFDLLPNNKVKLRFLMLFKNVLDKQLVALVKEVSLPKNIKERDMLMELTETQTQSSYFYNVMIDMSFNKDVSKAFFPSLIVSRSIEINPAMKDAIWHAWRMKIKQSHEQNLDQMLCKMTDLNQEWLSEKFYHAPGSIMTPKNTLSFTINLMQIKFMLKAFDFCRKGSVIKDLLKERIVKGELDYTQIVDKKLARIVKWSANVIEQGKRLIKKYSDISKMKYVSTYEMYGFHFYAYLYDLIDLPKTGETQLAKTYQSVKKIIKGRTIPVDSRSSIEGSYINTFSVMSAILWSEKPDQDILNLFHEMAKTLNGENEQRVPYAPVVGTSDKNERAAVARNVGFYTALYKNREMLKDNKIDLEKRLFDSVMGFGKYIRDLTLNSYRGLYHLGDDHLGTHYYIPSLPFITMGIKELMQSKDVSVERKIAVSKVAKAIERNILLTVGKDGMPLPMTGRFSNMMFYESKGYSNVLTGLGMMNLLSL